MIEKDKTINIIMLPRNYGKSKFMEKYKEAAVKEGIERITFKRAIKAYKKHFYIDTDTVDNKKGVALGEILEAIK